MDDKKLFDSKIAPIWDFETTHPNASSEERLKACLMRESISEPYNKRARELVDELRAENAQIKSMLEKLAEALENVIPYAEKGIPEPSHHGSCTPETICDMDCSHAFHGANALYVAEQALAEYRAMKDGK